MVTIKFLETLGRNAALSDADYRTAVESLELAPNESQCLIGRDSTKLASLLGGRSQMWCAVMVPEDMPDEDAPLEPGHEPDPGEQEPR